MRLIHYRIYYSRKKVFNTGRGCTGFPGENTPPYLPNFVIEKKVLKD
jgi:hypothetical protein